MERYAMRRSFALALLIAAAPLAAQPTLPSALALAALWLLVRPGRAGLQLIAAALLFACAGYAWQGHPELAGAPRRPAERQAGADSAFSAMRGEMLGRFDTADIWLTMSES